MLLAHGSGRCAVVTRPELDESTAGGTPEKTMDDGGGGAS